MIYTKRLWLTAVLGLACFTTCPCRADIDRYSNPIGFNVGIESFGGGSIGVDLTTGEKLEVNLADYPELRFYALTSTTPITSLHFTNSNAISLDNITIGHRAAAQRHYIVDAIYPS